MSLRTQFNYRFEPVFQSSFNLSINKISLPEFYGDGRLILATSKFNLTFNKSLFWMNYLQYSNVSKILELIQDFNGGLLHSQIYTLFLTTIIYMKIL